MQDKVEKEIFAVNLLKQGISHRNVNDFCKKKFGEGISHTRLSEMDNDLRSGIDPLAGSGSNADHELILKQQELIIILKAKKEEQLIALKQFFKFFMAISNELDALDLSTNTKLTINQKRFNQMIDENLDDKVISKYEFLLKEDS